MNLGGAERVESVHPPDAVPDDDLLQRPAEVAVPGSGLAPSPPALTDAWPWARYIPLVGWLERNGFHPLWTALLVFILAFILFQVVIAPIVIGVGIAIDLVGRGETEPPDVGTLLEELQTNARLMMTANTVGQWGGFALLAVAVSRLHTTAWTSFLRLRKVDPKALGLAALGWAVMWPGVIWSGQLNERVPLPQWLEEVETMQTEMLESMLMGGDLSTPFLFVALAVTPAICEELLFRGYLQRQVERGWGTTTSIVLVGVLFGAYHLRLSQLIPLSLLGIYMGYVVWATGSLWSGVLVHFLNNGLAVVATAFVRDGEVDAAVIEDAGVPWYFGLAGLVLAAGVSKLLLDYRRSRVGATPDSQPAAPPPALPSLPVPS